MDNTRGAPRGTPTCSSSSFFASSSSPFSSSSSSSPRLQVLKEFHKDLLLSTIKVKIAVMKETKAKLTRLISQDSENPLPVDVVVMVVVVVTVDVAVDVRLVYV